VAQPPPLYIPDLSKPAGAALDEAGLAACITCKTRLPPAKLDIVGQGYRCAGCTHKAQIDMLAHGGGDVSANLSSEDRSALSSAGMKLVASGVGITLLGVVLIGATAGGFGKYVLAAGIGSLVLGFGRLSTAKSR
jgi:hypothetical protein